MKRRQFKSGRVYLGRVLKLLWPVVWLNAFFDRYTGGRNRPAFFDIDSTFPALNHVTEHQAIIKEELAAILQAKASIPRYHDIDLIQFSISGRIDKDKDWKILMLYAMGEGPAANRALCPATCALLDTIPDLFQAFFSILDAGKSIPPHTGPYRGYLRYHLALKVPRRNPPSLRVKDQWYVWQEGKSILFDDTHCHEVVNRADDDRVILVIDVLRPMPPAPRFVNRLIAQRAAKYVYAKGVMKMSLLIWRLSKMVRRSA
ncbi:MAG TPA: aspartyl/asparaginyl beta-hydroxylase domain-containing protein [Candidatus Binataceae bacterium]|nr:aspartyl/asparaginyl beta-hydroxylase domain-containing protein [Candidatus Binataceae bacterium]